MKKKMNVVILGACALFLALGRTGFAQVSVSNRSPLLEFHGTRRTINLGPVTGVTYTSDTLLVYKDGYSLWSFTGNTIPSNQPFSAHVTQGTVPAAFAVLNQALQNNMIGIQTGNCTVSSISGDYDYELTWYGKQSRLNSLRVASSFPNECANAVKNIILAIGAYEAALP